MGCRWYMNFNVQVDFIIFSLLQFNSWLEMIQNFII